MDRDILLSTYLLYNSDQYRKHSIPSNELEKQAGAANFLLLPLAFVSSVFTNLREKYTKIKKMQAKPLQGSSNLVFIVIFLSFS